MKKIKLNLSGFDLGCIIAFAVLTILGAGGWWYLSGDLAAAQADVQTAKTEFDKVSSNDKYKVVVSGNSAKNLQDNLGMLKDQVNPILLEKFLSKNNSLSAVRNEDSVTWKHDLDDQVHNLNTLAKNHNVTLPDKFYYGFSSYLSTNPNDAQTGVLKKQMLAINEIATILIDAPVKNITSIRRTYEENAGSAGGKSEGDSLPDHSHMGPAGAYVAYPFDVSFETTPENLRVIVENLLKSPYVFVIRAMTIQNSSMSSPQQADLDKMAGPATTTPSVVDASPGEVAATTPPKGPQYLFGNTTLKIKMRIDLIEWNAGLIADKEKGADKATDKDKGKK